MTLYLTETTDVMDLAKGFAKNLISAVKLYPREQQLILRLG